mmetsp:Transcript_16563/g.29826  ORF Transcript_16563/g.29826 Transcript_16563/m.29826 type:complete len:161 (+) Transcript_16563:46-528(+)
MKRYASTQRKSSDILPEVRSRSTRNQHTAPSTLLSLSFTENFTRYDDNLRVKRSSVDRSLRKSFDALSPVFEVPKDETADNTPRESVMRLASIRPEPCKVILDMSQIAEHLTTPRRKLDTSNWTELKLPKCSMSVKARKTSARGLNRVLRRSIWVARSSY